jgi:uncharacterized membrane protein
MKKMYLVVVFLYLISGVFAQVYNVEFQQVYDKVVIKEKINDSNFNYLNVVDLERSNSNYFFVYRYNFSENYSNIDVQVVFVIDEEFITNEIFPQGYDIGDNEIIWNVSAGKPFAIFISLEKKNNYAWILWIVLILVVLFLSRKFFIRTNNKTFKKKSPKRIVKNIKIDERYLLDEERRVIEMLKKADRNEMWQNSIQKQGNFSKAKTSRMIKNLESRGLVKKIPFGNTNKIVLK